MSAWRDLSGAKKRGDLSVSLNVDNYFCRDTTRILRNAEVVLTVLIIIRTSRMWFTLNHNYSKDKAGEADVLHNR